MTNENITVGNFGGKQTAEQLLLYVSKEETEGVEIMVVSWLDKNTMIKTRWISPSYITIIGLLETTKVQIIQECFSDE